MKKRLKKIKTSFASRGFSLAKLGLQAGTELAAHSIDKLFSKIPEKELKHFLLKKQIELLSTEMGLLKGSIMKAGQMFSVYGEHFLHPEINQILKKLQFNSTPLEWKAIQKILFKELEKELLQELQIEEEAYAAASLGQVHRAKIKKTKQEIVLKIQYPGVNKAIEGDIKALRTLLNFTKILPKIPNADSIFDEIKTMLYQELNYEQELLMLEKFHILLANDKRFILPIPFKKYSSKQVIAMSYEEGETVDSDAVNKLSQERKNALASAILELFFRELYDFHSMQTDPHFGNYRIRIDSNGNDDKLILFDYGAVRHFPKDFILKHKKMMQSIIFKNQGEFEKAALNLDVLKIEDSEKLKKIFYELCSMILEPFQEKQPYEWGDKTLPQRIAKTSIQIIQEFNLRTPPKEVLFLDRKMIGMYTFLSALDAKIDARKILLRYM